MCSSDLFPSHDRIGDHRPTKPNKSKFVAQVGQDVGRSWKVPMGDTATLEAGDSVKDYTNFWKSVKIRFYNQ